MKLRFLHTGFVCLVALLYSMFARAASTLTLTWEDTPLHGSYSCTYYTLDTAPIAAALGLSAEDFVGYSQSGDIKVGTYTSSGTVSTATDAGADGFSGYWLNANGVQSGWSSGYIYFVYDPAGRIGIGQMPISVSDRTHCEPGNSVTFHAIYQYNGQEADVELTYKTTYKVSYDNYKKEAQAALTSSIYASVSGSPRTNLQNTVAAAVTETEDGWLAAANAIKTALETFTGSVTGAGEYTLQDGPAHQNFDCTYLTIDNDAIAKVLGITAEELKANYNNNASGSTITMGTYDTSGNLFVATNDAGANNGSYIGYWLNKQGQRCGWGSKACIYFVYDPAGRIGIGQMPTTQSTGDKVAAGDKVPFTVVFKYGDKKATVQVSYELTFGKWLQTLVESTPDYSDPTSYTYVTTSMLNDYKAMRATAASKYDAVNSENEVLDIYNPLKASADSLAANIELWLVYKKAVDRAQKEVIDDADYVIWSDAADDLEEYLSEAQSNLNKAELANDGLRSEIAKLTNLFKEALKAGVKPGANITDKYLVNADFETTSGSGRGWIVDGSNVNWGGNSSNHCIEASNSSSFDVYQQLNDMPVGLYTVKVNGYYRYGNGSSSLTYFEDGTAASHKNDVKVYVNGNTSTFMNVYDEKVPVGTDYTEGNAIKDAAQTYWYPNNMSDAATAFKKGRYEAVTFGVVSSPDDVLRIGVKGSTNQGGSWSAWDNFNVIYGGTVASAVQPVLQAKIADMKELMASETVFGTEAMEKAKADLATAAEAVAGSDGEAKFKALCSLIDDQTMLSNSASTIDSLKTLNENLEHNITQFKNTAAADAVTNATTIYNEVNAHLTAKDLNTVEARAYMLKIAEAITKLRMPADPSETDYTSVIINPGYDNDGEGTNSFNGWTERGYKHSFGNSDYQKNALLVEYHKAFDVSQTIYGLPAGKYKVTVSCFSRYGSLSNDYKVYFSNPDTLNNAYLYAVNGKNDSTKVSVAFISSGAYENAGISGQTSIDGKNVPNDMVSAGQWFNNGYYCNEVLVDVTDGKLTIGICKFENTGDDWAILDNWTLTYVGNSTGIHGVVNAADENVVSTEIYDLSGMRRNSLARGVNIMKMKSADGRTIVKKKIVK